MHQRLDRQTADGEGEGEGEGGEAFDVVAAIETAVGVVVVEIEDLLVELVGLFSIYKSFCVGGVDWKGTPNAGEFGYEMFSLLGDAVQVRFASQVNLVVDDGGRGVDFVVKLVGGDDLKRLAVVEDQCRSVATG